MNIKHDDNLKLALLELKQGSQSAFNLIYAFYVKKLYSKVYSIVKDEAKAEELIQDLFLKVWQKREEINVSLSFQAFLYTVAQNLVYDYLRKAASDRRIAAHLLLNSVNYYMHTEEALSEKETSRILHIALNRLSPQQRQVFTLCKLEGKSYEEAAKILGITTATVNSHIVKASRFIRTYLSKNLELSIWILCILNVPHK